MSREGLTELADLHFRQLLSNSATEATIREEATRKLGLRDLGGELLTEEQIAQRRKVADRVEDAMQRWRPELVAWQRAIESDSGKRRDYAIQQMHEVDDPYIIPVIETFVSNSGTQFGRQVVALLSRFPDHEATETLVRFALLSPDESVCEAAIGELKQRPLHDFAPLLLGGLISPIQTQWRVFADPEGNVRYQHVLYRDGQDANQMLAAEHVAIAHEETVGETIVAPGPPDRTARPVAFDRFRPADNGFALRLQADIAVATAAEREHNVALSNARIQQANSRIYRVLEETSGAAVPSNPANWWYWWEEYNESYKRRPTEYAYLPSSHDYSQPVVAQYLAFATRVLVSSPEPPCGQKPAWFPSSKCRSVIVCSRRVPTRENWH